MIDKVAEQEKRLSASDASPKSSPKFFKRKKKEERDVNAALNERLSKLLMENETVKEKVRFLEEISQICDFITFSWIDLWNTYEPCTYRTGRTFYN